MKQHKCDICGRELFKKNQMQGYILCSKHMHQLYKYGKFLDNIQRTNNDLNDYKINYEEQIVSFNVYNQKNILIEKFIIDLEDIEKVKYHKWRMNHGHVVTGSPSKGTQRDVSHIVLDFDARISNKVVDHIDGNPFNNRKNNLRIISQADNVKNQSLSTRNTSNFKGVSYDKERNRWASEIRFNHNRIHFTRRQDKREAVYQRLIAEQLLFSEFVRQSELKRMEEYTKGLDDKIKEELENYVKTKLKDKNLCA